MKKRKLLATIFTSGALLAATPVVATACTNDKQTVDTTNYIVYDGKKLVFDNFDQSDINSLVPVYNAANKSFSMTLRGVVYDTAKITEINIGSPDENVETIPDYFLSYNYISLLVNQYDPYQSSVPNLAKVNLSQLKNIKKIGNFFMSVLPKVTELYLPTLVYDGEKAPTIGRECLFHLPVLKKLDLSPLSNVACLPTGFMSEDLDDPDQFERGKNAADIIGLEELDMSMFHLTEDSYGGGSLNNLVNIKSFKLPYIGTSLLSRVKGPKIHLMNCWSLESLDYTPWKYCLIGMGPCVTNCFNLTDIYLPPEIDRTSFSGEVVDPDICIKTEFQPLFAKSYTQGIRLHATEIQKRWFKSDDLYPESHRQNDWRHYAN